MRIIAKYLAVLLSLLFTAGIFLIPVSAGNLSATLQSPPQNELNPEGTPNSPSSITSYRIYLPLTFRPVPVEMPVTSPRVNLPYFSNGINPGETAIFWFGKVTPTENYVDVRTGYDDHELYIQLNIIDRRLWYATQPSLSTLTNWDSATIYLSTANSSEHTLIPNTYRFDAQLSWWETPSNYTAAYQGNGANWTPTSLLYTTVPGYRGDAPNNNTDDRGWTMTYHIPFTSLGLSAKPADGTIWKLAITVHDRDDASGTPIPDETWPQGATSGEPSSWGQLHFGLPVYIPPPATSGGTVEIRHKLNGATVVDAAVGGSTTCGNGLDFWTQWGEVNYANHTEVNVQNQSDVADWPCFSKYYVTFPLEALPTGKVILSAKLTLHQFGNSQPSEAKPSLIQVLTVGQDWDESTLTWNTAPLPLENVGQSWVDPLPGFPGSPGIPRDWDLSRTVAQAYRAGTPLRLVLYDADSAKHSGKYFISSDTGDWNEAARPTLTVTWGNPY